MGLTALQRRLVRAIMDCNNITEAIRNEALLVVREDKTATVDGGAGPIEGKWYIKNGYIFIDREKKADLMAKIPSGEFNSITLEKDPNNHDGKWNSEVMTKVANDNNK